MDVIYIVLWEATKLFHQLLLATSPFPFFVIFLVRFRRKVFPSPRGFFERSSRHLAVPSFHRHRAGKSASAARRTLEGNVNGKSTPSTHPPLTDWYDFIGPLRFIDAAALYMIDSCRLRGFTDATVLPCYTFSTWIFMYSCADAAGYRCYANPTLVQFFFFFNDEKTFQDFYTYRRIVHI